MPANLIVSFLIVMLSSCFSGNNIDAAKSSVADTTVIASVSKAFDLNPNKRTIEAFLTLENVLNRSRKHLLQLKNVKLLQVPEGVYEVYISKDKMNKTNIFSDNPCFVGVIDTYSLSGNSEHENVLLSIARNVTLVNKPGSTFFVTILFRGNALDNKKESENSGHLTFEKAALLQVE